MTQAAAQSSQPTAVGAATIPQASRVYDRFKPELYINACFSSCPYVETFNTSGSRRGRRQLPANPRARDEPGGGNETSAGGTGATRILEHAGLEIDGGSTAGGRWDGGGRHQGAGMGREGGMRGSEEAAVNEPRLKSQGKTPARGGQPKCF